MPAGPRAATLRHGPTDWKRGLARAAGLAAEVVLDLNAWHAGRAAGGHDGSGQQASRPHSWHSATALPVAASTCSAAVSMSASAGWASRKTEARPAGGGHQAAVPQAGQVLGHRGLRQPQRGGQVRDPGRADGKAAHDHQPRRVAQGPEQRRGRRQLHPLYCGIRGCHRHATMLSPSNGAVSGQRGAAGGGAGAGSEGLGDPQHRVSSRPPGTPSQPASGCPAGPVTRARVVVSCRG